MFHMRPFFLLLAPLALPATAQVTDKDIQADLAAVNAHLKGSAEFDLDRNDRLTIDLFENGQHYRRDQVYVEFLAPERFAYSEEEMIVMLRCMDDNAQCIDKELKKTGTIGRTGRTSLVPPAGDAQGAITLALISKLIQDVKAMQERTGTRPRPSP
jgi:hypothetical protein